MLRAAGRRMQAHKLDEARVRRYWDCNHSVTLSEHPLFVMNVSRTLPTPHPTGFSGASSRARLLLLRSP
jgi:hypothetical protein